MVALTGLEAAQRLLAQDEYSLSRLLAIGVAQCDNSTASGPKWVKRGVGEMPRRSDSLDDEEEEDEEEEKEEESERAEGEGEGKGEGEEKENEAAETLTGDDNPVPGEELEEQEEAVPTEDDTPVSDDSSSAEVESSEENTENAETDADSDADSPASTKASTASETAPEPLPAAEKETEKDEGAWPEFSRADVENHSSLEDGDGRVWVTYGTGVYDITDFLKQHPGGAEQISMAIGSDIGPFWQQYQQHHHPAVYEQLAKLQIGVLKPGEDVVKVMDSDDPYIDEPRRVPELEALALKQTPFNAETPSDSRMTYITPNNLWYVRHHFPVPRIDPDDFELDLTVVQVSRMWRIVLCTVTYFLSSSLCSLLVGVISLVSMFQLPWDSPNRSYKPLIIRARHSPPWTKPALPAITTPERTL